MVCPMLFCLIFAAVITILFTSFVLSDFRDSHHLSFRMQLIILLKQTTSDLPLISAKYNESLYFSLSYVFSHLVPYTTSPFANSVIFCIALLRYIILHQL